jgi:hypothetical protein
VVDLYNGDTLLHEVQAKAIETVDDWNITVEHDPL